MKVFARIFGGEIVLACLPRAAQIGCQFANVYLVQAILTFLASPDSAESITRGGLLSATALSYLGIMVWTIWLPQRSEYTEESFIGYKKYGDVYDESSRGQGAQHPFCSSDKNDHASTHI